MYVPGTHMAGQCHLWALPKLTALSWRYVLVLKEGTGVCLKGKNLKDYLLNIKVKAMLCFQLICQAQK